MIYYYKLKGYLILYESKIKLNGEWKDCVIYKCLYANPDGMVWVREKDDFFSNFKPSTDELTLPR